MPNPARIAASWARSLFAQGETQRFRPGKLLQDRARRRRGRVDADQIVMRKVGEGLRLALPLQIRAMRMQADRGRRELFREQRLLRRRRLAHGHIRFAHQHILHVVGQHELDIDAGLGDAQRRQDRRHSLHAHVLAGADPDNAGHLALAAFGGAQQRRRRSGDGFGLRQHGFRDVGGGQPSRGPDEKLDAERTLQALHVPGDGGLREAQRARRRRERTEPGHREEGPVVRPVRLRLHGFSYIRSTKFQNLSSGRDERVSPHRGSPAHEDLQCPHTTQPQSVAVATVPP